MSTIQFTLIGSIPSKKNGKEIRINRRTGSRFLASSDRHQAWHPVAAMQINTQKPAGFKTLEKCRRITVTIYYGDLRAKDNSNVIESIHDLLVDCGVIVDDNWKVTGPTLQIPVYRKKEPGAEILIDF